MTKVFPEKKIYILYTEVEIFEHTRPDCLSVSLSVCLFIRTKKNTYIFGIYKHYINFPTYVNHKTTMDYIKNIRKR